jgi:hypothetical protein
LGHFTIPMLFYGNPFILVTIINLKNSWWDQIVSQRS